MLEPVESPLPARTPKREALEKELEIAQYPALYQNTELFIHVTLLRRESLPTTVLKDPFVFESCELCQTAVLAFPLKFENNELYQIAVLSIALSVPDINTPFPNAVLELLLLEPRPTVIPFTVASAVVTILLFAPERRNPSILFRLNMRSLLSVVPIKLASISVPELPVRVHALLLSVCQVAFPVVSLVRIYPDVAPDETRRP